MPYRRHPRGVATSVNASRGADRPAQQTPKPPPGADHHLYGFHLQAFRSVWAVARVLSSVRRFYLRERVFVVTDDCRAGGGYNYSALCHRFAPCEWVSYMSSAGYGAHAGSDSRTGIAWLRRVELSMRRCECTFLINLEDDTCLFSAIVIPPPIDGAVGGLPFPRFRPSFLRHAAAVSGRPAAPGGQAWGCSGGCYYRTDFFTRLMAERPQLWSDAAAAAASQARQT